MNVDLLDEGRDVALVYFDFSKAFDAASRDIPMKKSWGSVGWMSSKVDWKLDQFQDLQGADQ